MDKFSNIDFQKILNDLQDQAMDLLNNSEQLEKFLQKLEKKLELIPYVGDELAVVPTFISLLRSYMLKEYTDIPLGSVIAIVVALIYFLSPFDIIPDAVPIVGHVDDGLVIIACLNLVKSDMEDYRKWREAHNETKVIS